MASPLRTLDPPRFNGRPTTPSSTVDTTSLRPRRSPARFVFGVLLAAVTVLVFVTVALRADHQQPVLAVARPVAAGQQLSAGDLVVVRVSVEPGVPVVPAGSLDDVLGRTAAVPLVRGALLAPRQLGPAAWPPAGQAVLAVPVKAGHAPAGLSAGATVMVLVTPAVAGGAPTTGSGSAVVQAQATVVSVQTASDGSGSVIVSLVLDQDAALRLAGAGAGDAQLVQLAPHG
jgi:SAF domain